MKTQDYNDGALGKLSAISNQHFEKLMGLTKYMYFMLEREDKLLKLYLE